MTIFGPDMASYQEGLKIASLTDAAFVIIKATQGDSYVDPYYADWVAQAKAADKLPCWYHFLTTSASPAAQAAHAKSVVDASLPGMLDWEPTTGSTPTFAFLISVIDAFTAEDLRIKIVYAPAWYIKQLGVTDISALVTRGVAIVSSNYPGASGTGPKQYAADGGDEGPGWAPYPGVTPKVVPAIWQFTDDAQEGGQKVDYNAYKGTIAQLAEFLDEPAPSGTPTAPPSSNRYPQIQKGSTGDAVVTLQRLLNKHGYGLLVDGKFGAHTDGAVRAYQASHSLSVDGQVGPKTWGSILAGEAGTPYPGIEIRQGMTGSTVRRVQQQLLNRGYNPQGVDGDFGKDTRAAAEAFQKANHLQVDGIVGVHTWGSLFN